MADEGMQRSGLNDPDLLEGWKAIADYLNKTERTVQRWEKAKGVPYGGLSRVRSRSYHGFLHTSRNWMPGGKITLPPTSIWTRRQFPKILRPARVTHLPRFNPYPARVRNRSVARGSYGLPLLPWFW